jgi:hypothetical protein
VLGWRFTSVTATKQTSFEFVSLHGNLFISLYKKSTIHTSSSAKWDRVKFVSDKHPINWSDAYICFQIIMTKILIAMYPILLARHRQLIQEILNFNRHAWCITSITIYQCYFLYSIFRWLTTKMCFISISGLPHFHSRGLSEKWVHGSLKYESIQRFCGFDQDCLVVKSSLLICRHLIAHASTAHAAWKEVLFLKRMSQSLLNLCELLYSDQDQEHYNNFRNIYIVCLNQLLISFWDWSTLEFIYICFSFASKVHLRCRMKRNDFWLQIQNRVLIDNRTRKNVTWAVTEVRVYTIIPSTAVLVTTVNLKLLYLLVISEEKQHKINCHGTNHNYSDLPTSQSYIFLCPT